jgi:hypothetical protein
VHERDEVLAELELLLETGPEAVGLFAQRLI